MDLTGGALKEVAARGLTAVFRQESPRLGWMEFDAVMSDTFEARVDVTTYPLEFGAIIADHAVILPRTYRLRGMVSDKQVKQTGAAQFGDLALSAVGNWTAGTNLDAGWLGIAAGFRSGSPDTRSGAALADLLTIQARRELIGVNAGDIYLPDMIITKISRTNDPSNEGALVFEAELQQVPRIRIPGSSWEEKSPVSAVATDDGENPGILGQIEKGVVSAMDAVQSALPIDFASLKETALGFLEETVGELPFGDLVPDLNDQEMGLTKWIT
jgi:hypothetical protein